MKIGLLFLGVLIFTCSCQKCDLKGNEILNEKFDAIGDWNLYSEYSAEDLRYSRVEDGLLKLKTSQDFPDCQRATYFWPEDLSIIKGFQVCIHIKQLILPKDVDVHFYFSFGNYELHTVIEKKKTTNTILKLRVNDNGVSSNLRGAVNGKLGAEIEGDNFPNALYPTNFMQISLCPEQDEDSTGELYLEIDKIEITTQ